MSRNNRLPVFLAVSIALLVLLFATATHSVWEDYYITFRSSRNLAEGHGLVYQAGDRLHTFTSPLGVLLPALTYLVTGSDQGAIWLFRILSAGALGASAWLLAAALQAQRWSGAACALAAVLGLAALKNIEFASNGMESGFLVFFTILAFAELIRDEGVRVGRLGCAFAGLMWTRPDAFIIAGALAAGSLLFADPGARKTLLKKGVLAVCLGLALYAPWPLFATLYYGSPVPQTIIAKAGAMSQGFSLLGIVLAPFRCLATNGILTETFAPDYWRIQQWGPDWHNLWGLLSAVSAFAWLWPQAPRAARIASLALLIGGVYLGQISVYPWYFTPWTALAGIVLAGFCAPGWRKTGAAVRIGTVIAVLSGIIVLVAGAVTAARRQTLVEEQVRARIGAWLKENARPDDTVFLEPVGYVGYFSEGRVRITDFPGLTSKSVSDETARGATTFAQLIARLRPAWLVLRPEEILQPDLQASRLLETDYVHRAVFSNRKRIEDAAWMPGRRWMLYDAEFHIYARKPGTAGPAPVSSSPPSAPAGPDRESSR